MLVYIHTILYVPVWVEGGERSYINTAYCSKCQQEGCRVCMRSCYLVGAVQDKGARAVVHDGVVVVLLPVPRRPPACPHTVLRLRDVSRLEYFTKTDRIFQLCETLLIREKWSWIRPWRRRILKQRRHWEARYMLNMHLHDIVYPFIVLTKST